MMARRAFAHCFRVALTGVSFVVVATLGSGNEQEAMKCEERVVNQGEGEHPLLAALRRGDAVLEGEFSATFEMGIPEEFRNPDCAQETTICTYTSIDGIKGLSQIYSYDRDLPYQGTGGRGCQVSTSLPNGALYFWRGLREDKLWSNDVSVKYLESEPLMVSPEGLVISPEGVVTCQGPHTYLEKHSLGNFKSMPVFDKFQMALGRGFSKHLQRVKSDRLLTNGLRELVVDGQWGEASPGEWVLRVATDVDPPLVREAEFFGTHGVRWTKCADDLTDGSPWRGICLVHDPYLCIQNTGTVECDNFSFGEKGSILYSPNSPYPDEAHGVDLTLVDFSTKADQVHLNRLRARLSGLFPFRTYMIDYTGPTPVQFPVEMLDLDAPPVPTSLPDRPE